LGVSLGSQIVEALSGLSAEEQLQQLNADAASFRTSVREGQLTEGQADALRGVLLQLLEGGQGTGQARVIVGELLGWLGDTRLLQSTDPAYWAELTLRSGDVFQMGRFPVTNAEYKAWVDAGGYEDADAWSDEGKAWLAATENAWPVLASRPGIETFLVPNQPVVGVSFYEAQAFAKAHNARLPRWYERVFAVRGLEKRPYPWGSPFGEGNTNSKEEVLERPCAVGLYVRDVTPDGVHDLAGNTAEWTEEQAGDEYLLHPGSFERPSLAAWAKALTSAEPEARWSALGFRLVRDPSA